MMHKRGVLPETGNGEIYINVYYQYQLIFSYLKCEHFVHISTTVIHPNVRADTVLLHEVTGVFENGPKVSFFIISIHNPDFQLSVYVRCKSNSNILR